jgi:type 1 glutamine amidotransferase
MRILVFCDDPYHPAANIRAALAPFAQYEGFQLDWLEDGRDWDPRQLDSYEVALLTKSNNLSHADAAPWLIGDVTRCFADFVSRGGGLLAVHSGIASYKDVPAVRAVLGGVFLSHPPVCDVLLQAAANHPIAAGVPPLFRIVDEHYHVALDDTSADVFLTSESSHGAQPAGWSRVEGKGRVCVLTPGHFPSVWLNPAYQQLLVNALRWVAPKSLSA